jgi:hypothetical protein
MQAPPYIKDGEFVEKASHKYHKLEINGNWATTFASGAEAQWCTQGSRSTAASSAGTKKSRKT